MTTLPGHKILRLIKGFGLGGAEMLSPIALPYLDRNTFNYRAGYFKKASAIGSAARDFCRERFSMERFVAEHERLFESMLRKD